MSEEKTEVIYAGCAELFPKTEPVRRYRNVDLPIKDVTVRIQSLFAGEVSKYEMAAMRSDGKTLIRAQLANANARLIVLCLVDQSGQRILNPATHVKRIEATWDHADIATLYSACVDHCGVNADVEGMAKNSSTTGDDSERSDSPDESAE